MFIAFSHFFLKKKLIAANLIQQKALDVDQTAIQEIIFTGTLKTTASIYHILEQSKEATLEFSKPTKQVL